MRALAFLFVLLVAGEAAGDDERPPCTPFDFTDQTAARRFWNELDRKSTVDPVIMPGLFDRPLGLFRWLARRTMTAFVFSAASSAPLPVDPPFDAVGKLFVAKKTGTSGAFCTASFIDTNIVMTAAHCICPSFCFDRILFTRVFGTGADEDFDVAAWTVPQEWLTLGEPDRFAFDTAFLSTTDTLKTATPIGIEPTIPPTGIAIGYPLTINSGMAPASAEGSTAFDATSGMILMQKNDLGEGSSGGPWIPATNHVAGGTLFSVASRFGSNDTSLFGPVLDTAAIAPLITRTRNRCR